jgi:nucleoside-diphosphate-sugar epimerase
MAVFVTGGHGHIASWTAYFLAKEGEKVIIYDTQPRAPGYLTEVSRNITFIKGDVMDFPGLTGVFRQYEDEIDGIIHTVALMGEFVPMNPHGNVMLNIGGFLNVLELARIFDIKKVLYTSTGAVYGAVEGVVSEERNPPNPADLYGATKVSCEYLGRQYENTFGLDFRICRLYFVYGPEKFPSQFINLYKVAFGALEGLKGLRLEKGADQKLDFTYIEDVARGVVLLYKARDLKHKIFNIATGVANSVGKVAQLAQKHTHFPVEVEIGPGKIMPRCEALDIRRAKEELGYQPHYRLEEGIKLYADWVGKMLKKK